jgi:hypothetical protein
MEDYMLGMCYIQTDFTVRFNTAVTPKMTILCWEKLSQTGSIKDMLWSGRPSTRAETCPGVNASGEHSPKKSLWK